MTQCVGRGRAFNHINRLPSRQRCGAPPPARASSPSPLVGGCTRGRTADVKAATSHRKPHMLDQNLKTQLKGYLANIRQPIELVEEQ